jgi:hypothetical protein
MDYDQHQHLAQIDLSMFGAVGTGGCGMSGIASAGAVLCSIPQQPLPAFGGMPAASATSHTASFHSKGVIGSFADLQSQAPAKKRCVTFGGEEIRYMTPSPEEHSAPTCAVGGAGFAALGFASLGSVGEFEAFNSPRSGWIAADEDEHDEQESAKKDSRRACAPISASRLVQRRWRSSAASGRR